MGAGDGTGPRPGGRSCFSSRKFICTPAGRRRLPACSSKPHERAENRFLVETHSDYIVDRIRISVRKGLLKPDDVSILYFEPEGAAVTIHNLTLDEDGNLQNAPAGYRDFFLKETDRLLGFEDTSDVHRRFRSP